MNTDFLEDHMSRVEKARDVRELKQASQDYAERRVMYPTVPPKTVWKHVWQEVRVNRVPLDDGGL